MSEAHRSAREGDAILDAALSNPLVVDDVVAVVDSFAAELVQNHLDVRWIKVAF